MRHPSQPKPQSASLLLQLHRWYLRVLIRGSLFLASATLLTADPSTDPSVAPISTTADQKSLQGVAIDQPQSRVDQSVSLNYSYVGDADLKSGAGGHLGEQTSHFNYSAKVPLNDQYSLTFGLGYNRIDFSQPAGSPLPYDLQTLSLSVGADYKISDEWSVFATVSPRLEMIDGWNNIESQDVDISGALGASYKPNKNLSLTFALDIDPDSSLGIPVIPFVGMRWQFADQWSLNAGFPRTSIDYQVLPNLRVSPIELSFEGGSFRTGSHYGDSVGAPQLNDRRLDYREVRVGAGADYAIEKNLDLTLNAGAAVYREFDFRDADTSPEVKPAPFVQVGVKLGF